MLAKHTTKSEYSINQRSTLPPESSKSRLCREAHHLSSLGRNRVPVPLIFWQHRLRAESPRNRPRLTSRPLARNRTIIMLQGAESLRLRSQGFEKAKSISQRSVEKVLGASFHEREGVTTTLQARGHCHQRHYSTD